MNRRLLRVISILLTVVMVMASTVGAEELVEEVFVEEAYSAEDGDNAGDAYSAEYAGDDNSENAFQESFDDEEALQPEELFYEESSATEEAAFVEEDYSSEDELSFSEEEVLSQAERSEEEIIAEENAAEEETYTESSPDEELDSTLSSAESLPTLADADKSTGSLRITMDFKSRDEGEICVQGEPHLFIYLKQTLTSDGKVPTTPHEYTIRLRNLSKGSGEFWTVSNRIGNPVAGTYSVEYYTPFAESEAECDRKVPSYVETAPDTSLMYEIKPGEAFAGATMKLSSEAVKELLISKTADTRMELDAKATTRASLIPGAYTKITGIKSTKAPFTYELYSSNSDGEEGELLMKTSTDGAVISEELGLGLYFNPVLLPSPGDYWFLIKEDNSDAPYFTPVAESIYCHAAVGYSDAGVLDITALEYFQGSVKDTSTNRKLTVTASLDELTIKGDNKDVSGETVYELYGPFEGHAPKRDDHGSFGRPIQTKQGSSYTFSNVELFDSWFTYVIVERASKEGEENRDHLVMITGHWTSEGAQWYIKDRASFTNKYTVSPVQQTFTIKNEIKGKPSTAQIFSFRLRRVSDGQTATVRIEGNSTKTKDVKLPAFSKPGTYEFRITEEIGTAPGFSYNTESKTYKLKYVVKDDGKGKLNVTTYVDGEKVMDEKPVLTFKNNYAVKVKVQHVDADSTKGVSGGKSKIVNKSGTVVKKTWKSDGTPKEVSITADGTYTIKEVKAPTGYQLAKDASFKIKDGVVTYKNEAVTTIKIPHKPVGATFYIKSSNGSLISGAKLRVKDSSGKIIASWVSGDTGYTLAGKLQLNKKYTFEQTNTVSGYEKADPVSFIFKSNGQKVTLIARDKTVEIKTLSAKGNEITVTWEKTTDKVTGYQISYSKNRDFSSGVKTINVSDRNSTTAVIKNLKNKTRYYVRMRTYKKSSGSDYDYYTYGAWSDVKSVKTK